MALTRKMLKAMGIEEEKIEQIIDEHVAVKSGLQTQIEELREKAEKAESHFDATVAGCGDIVVTMMCRGEAIGEAGFTSTGDDDMGHIHITAIAHGPVSVVNSCADVTVYRCSLLMRELS